MNVTLKLASDIGNQASAQAQEQGLDLEEYLPTIIERGLRATELDEFEADMDALASGSEHWPSQPPDAFSRENIYADRP